MTFPIGINISIKAVWTVIEESELAKLSKIMKEESRIVNLR